MTFSPKAIEAALQAYRDEAKDGRFANRICMEAALTAALAVDGMALQGWQEIESAHPCDPSHSMSFYQPPAASDREERR